MRYRVKIPTPSAKRLEIDRRLVAKLYSGWFGGKIVAEYPIPEGAELVEFDFNREIEHRDPNVLDGDYYHEFVVVFRNSTGSRQEEVNVSKEIEKVSENE